MIVIPAQAGIQKFGFTVIFKIFLKCRGLDSRLRGNDGGRFGLIRKRTYKGRLKIGIAESAKSFSDDLFFKAESNQPAG